MPDADLLLDIPGLQFGTGVIGVCDVCKIRQAVIVLAKERFQLCVIDFLNKSWTGSQAIPSRPLPAYRSDRVWFDTTVVPTGRAPAIALSPTKVVKHPHALVVPDIYGLTAGTLEAGIRLAREGFEVLLPDLGRTPGVGPADHVVVHRRAGVSVGHPRVQRLVSLYADALEHLRGRDMVDAEKGAIVGLSYGGSLAVALAASDPRIKALALAYPMPVIPFDFPRLLGLPVLVIVPQSDRRAVAARKQFEQAITSNGRIEFADFPGARQHFLSREMKAYSVADAERAWSAMAAFLKRTLLPPPPKPPAPILRPAAPAAPAASPTLPAPPSAAATPVTPGAA